MVAAVYERERPRLLAEHHVAVAVHNGEVAVEEHGAGLGRGVERLLPVQVDGAVKVNTVAGERVVGAFKVAAVV